MEIEYSIPADIEVEKLVKEHFWFLVDGYNFVYQGLQNHGRNFDFLSPKMRIRVTVGHKSPEAFFYKVGEPKNVVLVLERIMQYFGERIPEIYYPDHQIEQNIKHLANLLKQQAGRVLSNIDEWWIPANLFQYKLLKELYQEKGRSEDFTTTFKEKYHYLKENGAFD